MIVSFTKKENSEEIAVSGEENNSSVWICRILSACGKKQQLGIDYGSEVQETVWIYILELSAMHGD